MSASAHTLDVRGLPAPEPLERCLDALADLMPDEQLVLLIDREPFPLYAILARDGFEHDCRPEDTHYRVTIRPA